MDAFITYQSLESYWRLLNQFSISLVDVQNRKGDLNDHNRSPSPKAYTV